MTTALCAILAATCLSGQLPALVPEAVAPEVSGGPYCGVYCVYSAARMSGRNATFEALLDNRYIGSWKGSTLAELRDAVASLGLTPTAMVGLTAASLKSCPHPVILHVRRPGRRMPYAHWVLYAGVQDGRARIVDPPAGVEAVTFAELDAVWDGVGIVVSHEPVVASEIKASAWLESASVLLAVIRLCGSARWPSPAPACCAWRAPQSSRRAGSRRATSAAVSPSSNP